MEHHVHNQGSCYHHSYPSFLTHLFFPTILLAGVQMFMKNRTTEMQYICLGYFAGNSHNNVPENSSPPLLVRKKCFLLSGF
jgi:hypothetical protein